MSVRQALTILGHGSALIKLITRKHVFFIIFLKVYLKMFNSNKLIAALVTITKR